VTTLILPPELFAGERASVEGEAYRHLFRARRLAVGDRLRVVDGRGGARWAVVEEVDRRRGSLRLLAPAPSNDPSYRLELLVATPKRERAGMLVEKATEVGVAAIRFLACERGPRQLGPGTLERLGRVAAAALEQCGGARLPEVSGVHHFGELAALLSGRPDRWFLDTGAGPGAGTEAGWGERGPVGGAALVGPEGGWTGAEAEALAALGCRPVWLGDRVLRIETAALMAAGALLLAPPGDSILVHR